MNTTSNKQLYDALVEAYLDYVCNFDTVEAYATGKMMSYDLASILIQAGRVVHSNRQEW